MSSEPGGVTEAQQEQPQTQGKPAKAVSTGERFVKLYSGAFGVAVVAIAAVAGIGPLIGTFGLPPAVLILVAIALVVVVPLLFCGLVILFGGKTGPYAQFGRTASWGMIAIAVLVIAGCVTAVSIAGHGNTSAAGALSQPTAPAIAAASESASATSASATAADTSSAVADSPSAPASSAGQDAGSQSGSASPTPQPVVPPVVTTPTDGAPGVWYRERNFTLPVNENADLNAQRPDFDMAAAMAWPPGDVIFSADGGKPYLNLSNNPWSTVPLGTGTGWTYSTCKNATYVENNADAPTDEEIAPGHSLCYFDSNTNRYFLIRIDSVSDLKIVFDVTAWDVPSN